MPPVEVIPLFGWSAVVAVALIVVLVVNVTRFCRFVTAARFDPSVAAVSKTAWLVSVIGALTGPLAIVAALVAVVLGAIELSRLKRAGPVHRTPAQLAVLNGVTILVATAGFVVLVLWFVHAVPP